MVQKTIQRSLSSNSAFLLSLKSRLRKTRKGHHITAGLVGTVVALLPLNSKGLFPFNICGELRFGTHRSHLNLRPIPRL